MPSDPRIHHTPASLRRRWPLPDAHEVCEELLAAWGGPYRGHHGLDHLGEVLENLDTLRPEPHTLPDASWRAVLLAAWFHDAVYDSAPEPETRSAQWAQRALAGRSDVAVEEVVRLVALTVAHDPTPDDLPGLLLCDADLAILGAVPQRYHEYAAGVRHEYSDVPAADFARARAAILRGFLARGAIYRNRAARELWEEQARANLAREITELNAAAGNL